MDYQNYFHWTKRAIYILAFSSILSGIFTYNGLSDDYSFGFAVLMASIGVVVSIVAWSFLFTEYPKATKERRKKLLAVVVVVSGLLLATSTQYAVGGLSGDKARLIHIVASLEKAEEKFSELFHRRKQEQSLVPSLESMSALFQGFMRHEVAKGAFSGRRRMGPVAASLGGLAQGYKEAVNALKKQDRAIGTQFTRGNRLLDDIRNTVNDQELSVKEKTTQVQHKFNELNTVFAEMQITALPTIMSLVERIDELFMVGGDHEHTGALKRVQQPIAESKALIMNQIGELGTKHIQIPRFRVMNKFEAVISYWGYCVPAISYSIAIDLVIPIMLLFFLCILASSDDDNDFRHPPKEKVNGKDEYSPISPSPVWDAIRCQSRGGNGDRARQVADR